MTGVPAELCGLLSGRAYALRLTPYALCLVELLEQAGRLTSPRNISQKKNLKKIDIQRPHNTIHTCVLILLYISVLILAASTSFFKKKISNEQRAAGAGDRILAVNGREVAPLVKSGDISLAVANVTALIRGAFFSLFSVLLYFFLCCIFLCCYMKCDISLAVANVAALIRGAFFFSLLAYENAHTHAAICVS
jgi:hypothetical protein